jgi:transposase
MGLKPSFNPNHPVRTMFVSHQLNPSSSFISQMVRSHHGRRSGPPQPRETRFVKRVQILVLLRTGCTVSDVVRKGYGKSQVMEMNAKLLANWSALDSELARDEPRSGRPPTVNTPANRRKVKTGLRHKMGASGRALAKKMKISHGSLRKIVKDLGLYPYKPATRPLLTAKQKSDRVWFAKEFKHHNWQTTFWTDEKDFHLYPKMNSQNVRFYSETPIDVPPDVTVNTSPKWKVWGGVSALGKSPLIFYEGTLKAPDYINIIKKAVPKVKQFMPDGAWTWQHDGASPHKAKLTNDWLEANVPDYITSGPSGAWPANSPDLSYIENIWAIMDAELALNPPKSMAELKKRIKEEWNKIKLPLLQRCSDGVPKRLTDVIRLKGECIGK